MSTIQSEQLHELAAALAKAQGKLENAVINKVNPHFKSKYADLASVLDAVRKPLSDHGLSVVQTVQLATEGPGQIPWLRTLLLHTSGQWIAAAYPLPNGGTPQQMGSALTYARRYSLSAITGIAADEDDDANAAQGAKRAAPKIGPNVIGVVPQGFNPATPPTPDAADHVTVPQQEPAVTSAAGGGLPNPMPPIATEAFKVASGGLEAYERWWLTLSKSERKQVLPYHDTIKTAAKEADAEIDQIS